MKFIAWLLLATAAAAAEPVKLPLDVGTLKTRDGKVFEAAKITGHDAVGVKVTHAGGVARLEYARLPKDLAAKFPRDRDAAKEQLEKEAKDQAANDKTVVKKTPAPASGTGEKAKNGVEKAPELKGDPAAQISALEAYIRRLEDGIASSQTTITIAQTEAKDLERQTIDYVDGYGKTRSRGKSRQLEQTRAVIAAEQDRISEASRLITKANAQLEELRSRVTPEP
ncbi:MAG TPA: hypothetical protein VGE67_02675 [Haloferula sp.]